MKQLLLLICIGITISCAAQSKSGMKERYEKTQPQDMSQITIKVNPEGTVENISTISENKNFDQQIKAAACKVTRDIKWIAAKDKAGVNVVDIVRLPFKY